MIRRANAPSDDARVRGNIGRGAFAAALLAPTLLAASMFGGGCSTVAGLSGYEFGDGAIDTNVLSDTAVEDVTIDLGVDVDVAPLPDTSSGPDAPPDAPPDVQADAPAEIVDVGYLGETCPSTAAGACGNNAVCCNSPSCTAHTCVPSCGTPGDPSCASEMICCPAGNPCVHQCVPDCRFASCKTGMCEDSGLCSAP